MSEPASLLLWRDIVEIADKVCVKYDLTYGSIKPCTNRRYRHYGEAGACPRCAKSKRIDDANCKEKVIRIRIHQLNRPNRPLKTTTILDTLAHELAHLRNWNHGEAHREFQAEIIDFIKSLGYTVR